MISAFGVEHTDISKALTQPQATKKSNSFHTSVGAVTGGTIGGAIKTGGGSFKMRAIKAGIGGTAGALAGRFGRMNQNKKKQINTAFNGSAVK
jgi:outer membrane lipoprotein SlyB